MASKFGNVCNKTTRGFVFVLLVLMFVVQGQSYALPATSTPSLQDDNPFHSMSLSKVSKMAPHQSGHQHTMFFPVKSRSHFMLAQTNSNIRAFVGRSIGALGNDGFCATASCGNLQYHSGPVMHNANILIVFWVGGSFSTCSTSHYFENSSNDPGAITPNDCSYMNLQVQFLKDICSDPFMKIAAQYTENSIGAGPCSVYVPPAGKFNPLVDTRSFPHNPVTDADLQTEAQNMLTQVGLSTNLNNDVYIFTPYGVQSCFGSDCFGTSFCAYHSSTGTLNYADIPDQASAFSITGHSCVYQTSGPNSDPVADAEINAFSHEFMESLTDPDGNGWYFQDFNHEIGDECAYDSNVHINADGSDVYLGIHGDPYIMQTEWSNANNGCTLVKDPLPTPPSSPPSGITANAISASSIRVSWAAATGATSYNVFRSTTSSGTFTTLAGQSSTLSFADTGLSPDTIYYYKLTASNSGGTSPISSSPASATTFLTTPQVPTGVIANAVSASSIHLSWNPSPSAANYTVFRSITSSGPFTTTVGLTDTTSINDTGLLSDTTYYYRLWASNDLGNSTLSSTASTTTLLPTPGSINATTLSSNYIAVSWIPTSNADFYILYRSNLPSGPFTTSVATQHATSFIDKTLSPGMQYYYKVKAVKAGVVSLLSDTGTALTAPPTPTGIKTTSMLSSSITLSWTASHTAINYTIFHSTNPSGPFDIAGTSTVPSFTDTGLDPDTKYYYGIAATNAGGRSANSTLTSFTTLIATPTGITATPTSSHSIHLSWTASPGAASYNIMRSAYSDSKFRYIVGTTTIPSFNDTGLDSGLTYYYKIAAVNGTKISPLSSPPVSATLP